MLFPEELAGVAEPTEVRDLEVVPCARIHDAEAYEIFTLPDGDYLGDEAMQEEAMTGCLDSFEGFVGTPYEESQYDVIWLAPNELSWNKLDHREVTCLAHDLSGAQVTGSLKGIGGGAEAAPGSSLKPKTEEITGPQGVETTSEPQAVESTPAPQTSESTQAAEPRTVSLWDLSLGDCYTLPTDPDAEFVEVVPCSLPHTDEVYLVFDLPDGEYPGDELIAELADEGCYTGFEPFVGTSYEASDLYYDYWAPMALTWTRWGDREVVCTVIDGQGGELTQSMRGAAR